MENNKLYIGFTIFLGISFIVNTYGFVYYITNKNIIGAIAWGLLLVINFITLFMKNDNYVLEVQPVSEDQK